MSTKAMTISAAILVFLLALGLTLYPLIFNQYNQQHQSQIHTAYQEQVEQMKMKIFSSPERWQLPTTKP